MAVDFFNPPAQSPIGPGIPYNIRQLPVAEVPSPSWWEILVIDVELPNDTPILRQIHRFPGTIPEPAVGTFGNPAIEHTYLPASRTMTLEGDAVLLRALIRNGTSGAIIDQAEIPGTWDSSYAWMISQQVQGGFTQTDREDLVLVKGAVMKSYTPSLAGQLPIVGSVIDLLRGPPRSVLRPFGSMLLEGRGVIPVLPPTNPEVLATHGGTWSWFTIPAGEGRFDGAITHFTHRVLQLAISREGSDDGLYTDIELQEDSEGGHVLWEFPTPSEIRYDLRPGWTAIWRWLV